MNRIFTYLLLRFMSPTSGIGDVPIMMSFRSRSPFLLYGLWPAVVVAGSALVVPLTLLWKGAGEDHLSAAGYRGLFGILVLALMVLKLPAFTRSLWSDLRARKRGRFVRP